MDLNTIKQVARPRARSELPVWTTGDAWLAGGTWLFSEPQVHLTRLIDLADLKWPPLEVSAAGLTIAATCTIAQLDALACPRDWLAAQLINQCCRAFLASFKIWKTATVGGNLCMSLPAGPMISLTSALDGICTIWRTDGSERKVAVSFTKMPEPHELREAILQGIGDGDYHDDVHGKPFWRKHMTLRLAEEIRTELVSAGVLP